jgi:uncharacterized membrane protein YuzA (DUF378 family)
VSLIPWSIAGLAVGYRSADEHWSLAGGLYGFGLLFVFMVAGYSGTAPILSRLPFFGIIGLAGVVYGIVLAYAAVLLRRTFRSSHRRRAG